MSAGVLKMGLEGAVSLVTGGGGRIGRAIAHALEQAGARVVSADLAYEAPADPSCVRCDVTKVAEVEALVERVAQEYGGLDLVVHGAGITRDAMLWKLGDEEWSAVLRANLDSGFYLLRAVAPHLRCSERGAAVLISSINGQRGKLGQANYAASKAGLIGLAKSAAREFGRDGARVNVVAPGFIETDMTGSLPAAIRERALQESVLGRLGSADDVAAAVLFLCSGLARHITGQVLRVDGGQLIA